MNKEKDIIKQKQAKNHLPKNTRTSCVILNYNDAATVEKLVQKIYHYTVFDAIVLVDNCSADNSLAQLQALAQKLNEKIIVLSAPKNGGYGAGNNVGIRYSYQVLHMDYVLVANPDVDFSEQLIQKMLRLFERHPELGVVSSCMHDPVFGKQRNGWPLYGFWRELTRCGPICRRVFRKFLEYPEWYFHHKKAVYVDAVHGSLLMVDAQKMMECGSYDEGLFLYQEEAVLGCRMRKAGYRSALLLTHSYHHLHSTSISQTYQKTWERQQLRNQSCMYYYQHYLHINPIQYLAAKLFFQAIHLEIWLYEKIVCLR